VVTPPAVDGPPRSPDSIRLYGLEVLARSTERLAEQSPAVRARTVLADGYPSTELLRLAARHRLVVVGSRGDSGLAGLLLGSVADYLVTHADCPVIVVPPEDGDPDGPVLVGVDGSDSNRPAVEYAFAAAEWHARGVIALSSVDKWRTGRQAGFAVLAEEERTVDLVREAVVPWADKYPGVSLEHHIVEGPPAQELVVASRTASLTVVGSGGHGSLTRLLLGSVSRHVSRNAHSPVAVVRQ